MDGLQSLPVGEGQAMPVLKVRCEFGNPPLAASMPLERSEFEILDLKVHGNPWA
jgi:hypothetical protein